MKLDNKQETYICKEYSENQRSIPDIAQELKTYNNMVRRALIKNGVELRSKQEAQKIALATGRSSHPTKGKAMSETTKQKIGQKQHDAWTKYSEEDFLKRSKLSKDSWEAMTKEQKLNMQKKASAALKKAAEDGSKIELFIWKGLLAAGYSVDHHKQNLIPQERMHLDMYLGKFKTAIEVDGVFHSKKVWTQEELDRQRHSDIKKNGLLISRGFNIIRVKHPKNVSQYKFNEALEKVKEALNNLEGMSGQLIKIDLDN